jgi:hypothetical protein
MSGGSEKPAKRGWSEGEQRKEMPPVGEKLLLRELCAPPFGLLALFWIIMDKILDFSSNILEKNN